MMKFSLRSLALASLLPHLFFSVSAFASTDSFIWLEQVESKQSMDWVDQQNQRSLAEVKKYPGFQGLVENSLSVLNSKQRIPYAHRMGSFYYNIWKDEANPRGLYRRTSLAEYKKSEPQWETVLDIDALSKTERVNWVFKGLTCLEPAYKHCLVSLSRGGADAVELREFDLSRKQFIDGGFQVAEAKTNVEWFDANTLLIATDFGDDSMTDSGYSRVVKRWQRGTAMADASLVYAADKKSVSTGAYKISHGSNKLTLVFENKTFYATRQLAYQNDKLFELNIPDNADILGMFQDRVYIQLKSEFQPQSQKFVTGSVVSIAVDKLLRSELDFELFVAPDQRNFVAKVSFSKTAIFVSWLENVRSRLSRYTPLVNNKWQRKDLDFSDKGTLSVFNVSDQYSDFFMDFSSFTEPASVYWVDGDNLHSEKIKSMPQLFAGDKFRVEQFSATSKDGTQVPYFAVMAKDLVLNGRNPTLLYGYGGFEISILPSYSAIVGKNWLEQGGVYVSANIRGGGEFGPAWHQAALKQNRHKAYEDFEAVAEDLMARKITSSKHLGIEGRSNGGLLVGNAFTRRPELYQAVVCQVPLLDMRRYNKLLAGASWMGEYGNPDLAEEWSYIQDFSPYHKLKSNIDYPKVFFTTSTRDDRVHPAHARKMVARMEQQGHDVLYYENIEGGHAGAADNRQKAELTALTYTYLLQQLK